ncbi:ribosomal silencing factor RsfS [Croceicoccus mobilis]|uniref:Ribosomal silencing factor RsfS n=2 Tax=Croceicoccus mobilis TaxID=1703339 RepID=A0A917DPY9_9SPHN|nr:ribosomal silencing factor RsfS [Croceicoccus mobilis]
MGVMFSGHAAKGVYEILMNQAQTATEKSGFVPAGDLASFDAEPGSLHELVLKSIDDDQGQDIVSIPLAGKSSIADHMVIASGRSSRQVAAMAQKLGERVKEAGFGPARIEGLPAADWVLIDAGDVVVHLFRPEVRSFYNLERMWGFGEGGNA